MKKKAVGKLSPIPVGTPAKSQEMVRTTIWLPQPLHHRLKQIGGTGGASEEIRKRLEASEKVPADPKTRELLSAITFVADKAGTHFGIGNWSEDRFSFEVLKEALELFLASHQPEGEAIAKPNPNRGVFDPYLPPANSPENVARFLLATWAALKREDEGRS